MKRLLMVLSLAAFLMFGSPLWAQQGKVTKVSPEKWQKLTPEQKEKFKEGSRKAQSAAQESVKDYNEVEKEATQAKKAAEMVRDTAIEVGKGALGAKVLPKK